MTSRFLLMFTALVAIAAFATSAGADSSLPVVMSGLDNPRGIAFGPQGALYVAEAGRGDIGENDGPCLHPGAVQVCYGATGAVSRLWHGKQDRVATGEMGPQRIPWRCITAPQFQRAHRRLCAHRRIINRG